MFLCDESESVDLIAQFPGDGIDFVTEFLLFLRGKRGEFPDLLEVGGEGIGEISAVDVGKRVFLRLSIFQFVMGGFPHASPQSGLWLAVSVRPFSYYKIAPIAHFSTS